MEQFLSQGTELKKGAYQIIEKVKQGGFGIVYKASCHNSLHEIVAIKEFYLSDICDREDVSVVHVTSSNKEKYEELKLRFIREAKMIHQLPHPNIVRVIDFFEENNTVYIVMEFIEMGNLDEKINKEGVLPIDISMEYIREIGNALTYMHENNMVHLDVKPSNIMIGQDGKAKLIDFGLTKQYSNFNTDTISKSTLIGYSDGFAPIEQYDRSKKKFLPCSDVYALASTFYYCITGITPPKSISRSLGDEALKNPCNINSQINKKVNMVINQAMAIKPIDRYQAVNDFLVDLEKVCKSKKYNFFFKQTKSGSVDKSNDTVQLGQKYKEKDTLINSDTDSKSISLSWLRKYKMVLLFIIIITIVVIFGMLIIRKSIPPSTANNSNIPTIQSSTINQEEKDWEKTVKENTLEAYQKYVIQYPSAKYTDEAKKRILNIEEENAWITTMQKNTLQSYNDYLSLYPKGNHITEANNKIAEFEHLQMINKQQQKEEEDWKAAKQKNTLQSYQYYLSSYSQGKHVTEAQNNIKELERQQTLQNEINERQQNLNQWNNTIENAINNYNTKNYANAKNLYSDALAFAQKQNMGSDYIAKSQQGIKDCEKQIQIQEAEKQRIENDAKIKVFLSQANNAFNTGDVDKAFALYKEARNLGSKDKTGYSNFLEKAKGMILHSGHSSYVKLLLQKATELDDAAKEAKDILNKYY